MDTADANRDGQRPRHYLTCPVAGMGPRAPPKWRARLEEPEVGISVPVHHARGGQGGATLPFRLRRGCGACRPLLRFAEGRVLSCVDFGVGGGPGSLGVRGSIPLSSTTLRDKSRDRRNQRNTACRAAFSIRVPIRNSRTPRRSSIVPVARSACRGWSCRTSCAASAGITGDLVRRVCFATSASRRPVRLE